MSAILAPSEVAAIAGRGDFTDTLDVGALADSHEALRANRDAWKAYAEHREDCRDCWVRIRDDAPPYRGTCRVGYDLQLAARSSAGNGRTET